MVLVDYEDYEELDTISSDDIYYDAGQAQLMKFRFSIFYVVKHFQCVNIYPSFPED